MNTYRGMEVKLHAFLTSAIDGGELSASRPGRFTPGTQLGGWVGQPSQTKVNCDKVIKFTLVLTPIFEL
jgi:hypothetical protein